MSHHSIGKCLSDLRSVPASRQRGASLVIVLMILIIVSILGIGGVQITLMGERGARNDRDYQIAWQAADAALVDAKFDIAGGAGITAIRTEIFSPGSRIGFVAGCGSSGNSTGLCLPATSGKPAWLMVDFTSANSPSAEFGAFTGRKFDAGDSLAGSVAMVKPIKKPRYIIEVLEDTEVLTNAGSSSAAKSVIYRITAMGFGPRADTQAVLQETYRKTEK